MSARRGTFCATKNSLCGFNAKMMFENLTDVTWIVVCSILGSVRRQRLWLKVKKKKRNAKRRVSPAGVWSPSGKT